MRTSVATILSALMTLIIGCGPTEPEPQVSSPINTKRPDNILVDPKDKNKDKDPKGKNDLPGPQNPPPNNQPAGIDPNKKNSPNDSDGADAPPQLKLLPRPDLLIQIEEKISKNKQALKETLSAVGDIQNGNGLLQEIDQYKSLLYKIEQRILLLEKKLKREESEALSEEIDNLNRQKELLKSLFEMLDRHKEIEAKIALRIENSKKFIAEHELAAQKYLELFKDTGKTVENTNRLLQEDWQLKNQIKDKKTGILKRFELRAKRAFLRTKLAVRKEEQEMATTAINKAKASVSDADSTLRDLNTEIEAAQSEIRSIKESIDKIKGELVKTQNALSDANK